MAMTAAHPGTAHSLPTLNTLEPSFSILSHMVLLPPTLVLAIEEETVKGRPGWYSLLPPGDRMPRNPQETGRREKEKEKTVL